MKKTIHQQTKNLRQNMLIASDGHKQRIREQKLVIKSAKRAIRMHKLLIKQAKIINKLENLEVR